MSFLTSLFSAKKKESDDPLSQLEREEQKDMMEGVSELDVKVVREVFVPRIDVEFIPIEATYQQVMSIVQEKGYSRYPVYEDNIDNIVGILYVKDLIKNNIEVDFDIRQKMRKAFFVPDSKHLHDLLRDFKKQKVHIAVAVDEYGGVSGIVCMEDIIEVIVGDIQDEFDEDEEEDIKEVDSRTFICDARTSIEDINEELNLNIPEDDYETLGGYVFEQFGCIPKEGDVKSTEDATFTVVSIDGHKINTIKVEVK